jgi:hypothetical protein
MKLRDNKSRDRGGRVGGKNFMCGVRGGLPNWLDTRICGIASFYAYINCFRTNIIAC